jgi:small subunit ribosomal protein S8
MSQDLISDCLCKIMNAKRAKKDEVSISLYSKFLIGVLELAKKEGYIENYEIKEKSKKLKIKIGKINNCNSIKPRYYVTKEEIDKYVKRYLPARNFGIIIVSTSKGLMTQNEAFENNIGGCLIAYFY